MKNDLPVNVQIQQYNNHSRSISPFSSLNNYTYPDVRLRPIRSALSTWKNPRRTIGETVFITSPTTVYIEHNNCYAKQLLNNDVVENKTNMSNSSLLNENKDHTIKKPLDFPKIKNTIYEESLECQEICFYLVDTDPDCRDDNFDTVNDNFNTENNQDGDYDSFESDVCSEESFKSDVGFHVKHKELPKLPNAQPYGIIKLAEKHMEKLKRRSIDFSKSLSRMTKRKSRADSNLSKSTKNENAVSIQPKINEDILESRKKQTSAIKCLPKNTGAIYENIDFAKIVSQKSTVDQEKEGISLLEKIRRSISISTDSASGLTSNSTNKPRSTFYLTDVIDIKDKNEDITLSNDNTKISKLNVIRPKSPPPPAPVKGTDKREANGAFKEISKHRTNLTTDIIHTEENETKSYICHSKIALYECLNNPPSASIGKSTNAINNNTHNNRVSQDYHNIRNESYSSNVSVSECDEENKLGETFIKITPDIQMLLEDEPLYQFYDAAVLESVCLDGIFHFEIDNYEEVDDKFCELRSDLKPSTTILDLPKKTAISFTKTLWCEIPEVRQSSVLSKLNTRQQKLQEAKFEIITSEASYVNSLNVLINHFALSIKECDCISEMEWQIIFGKVTSVKTCSELLLQELEKCWQDNILLYGICNIIQKQAEDNFSVYIPYCENQIMMGDTLKQLMERPGFLNYLRDLESSSSCQFLTLYSFLMLPMQRITRWPLLVDAVLKRLSQSDPEYIICQYTLASLNKIVNQCNEAARKKERDIELQTIANKLKFLEGIIPVNIVSPHRWLIRSGGVTNIQPKSDDSKLTFGKRTNKTHLYLYLFNDLFFVTREQSNGTYSILHYCPTNLVELVDTDMSLLLPRKEGHERNLLFLTILENQDGRTVEYILSCNKESDKERWLEAISPPKSEDPEETLYEYWDCPQVTTLHNYISVQPDELSLSRGDIINVLRKMADGWYHGERIRDGQTGWFPANYTSEIINPHVRARNLKQRYRLLAFSERYLKSC